MFIYYRTLILLLPLLAVLGATRAQFALVEDKDGFANVREKAGRQAPVIGKVRSGDIVFCLDSVGDWYNVEYYTTTKENTTGYVHTSRLKIIDDLQRIPVSVSTADSIVFRNDVLILTICKTPFVPRNNKLGYRRIEEGGQYLAKINHHTFWGTDGEIPKYQYKRFTGSWKGKPVLLPDSALYDVFNPNLRRTEVRYDAPNNRWFITAMNSDGAGGYLVVWLFEEDRFKKRYVFNGS